MTDNLIKFPQDRMIWGRLDPIYPAWNPAKECYVHVIYNYLGWEVPRFANLSVFEQKWLDHLKGYRHKEVHDYLDADRGRRDYEITMKLYGEMPPMENTRWP